MNMDTFSEIARREWRRMVGDRNILLVLSLAPLAYLLIFGFEYANRKVYDLPMAVVDYDGSLLSRTIIRDLDANEAVKVEEVLHDESTLREKFLTEECWAAVVIPPHFERDIKHGTHATVLMIVNSADIVIYDYAATGVQSVLGTFGAGVSIEKMMKTGTSAGAVRDSYVPVMLQNHILFNPTLTYSNFILPLLFMLLLHQVLVLAGGMSWAGEWEKTGADMIDRSLIGRWDVFAAKSFPYALIALAWLAVIVFGAHAWLGVPFVANPAILVLFWILFSVNVTVLAALVGTLIRSKVGVVQMLFLYSMPALLISGTVWPFSAMPAPIRAVAMVLPSTHILTAYRTMALEGAGLSNVTSPLLWLVVTATGLLGLLRIVIRRDVRLMEGSKR